MKAFETLEKEKVMCEAERCLLCYDPPCSKACPNKCAPAEFIRSLHFENEAGAFQRVAEVENALELVQACDKKYCELACIRGKLDRPVEVKAIHEYLAKHRKEGEE